jgi:hypothetical protein
VVVDDVVDLRPVEFVFRAQIRTWEGLGLCPGYRSVVHDVSQIRTWEGLELLAELQVVLVLGVFGFELVGAFEGRAG